VTRRVAAAWLGQAASLGHEGETRAPPGRIEGPGRATRGGWRLRGCPHRTGAALWPRGEIKKRTDWGFQSFKSRVEAAERCQPAPGRPTDHLHLLFGLLWTPSPSRACYPTQTVLWFCLCRAAAWRTDTLGVCWEITAFSGEKRGSLAAQRPQQVIFPALIQGKWGISAVRASGHRSPAGNLPPPCPCPGKGTSSRSHSACWAAGSRKPGIIFGGELGKPVVAGGHPGWDGTTGGAVVAVTNTENPGCSPGLFSYQHPPDWRSFSLISSNMNAKKERI